MKYLFIILLLLKFIFTNAFSEIINNIEIKNNNRITKETSITFGGIELGKDYSQQQLNDILLDLYSTNFFQTLSLILKKTLYLLQLKKGKLFNK